MDEVVHEFLVESHENLDQLDVDLVALERDPTSQPLLASVFRTIHTIKGTSGFLAFTNLERLTHAGEGVLSRLRDGELALTPELTSVLLELVDAVRELLRGIEDTGTEPATDESAVAHAELIERLAGFQAALRAPESAAPAEPAHGATPSATAESDSAANGGPRLLGERLVEEGIVHPDDVTLAVLEQHAGDARRIGEILVEHGAVDETTLHEVLDDTQPDGRRSVADATVRVDVGVLDDLMRLVGELLLTRNQVSGAIAALGDLTVTRAWQRLNAITANLQDGVIRARMQPIDSVWNKLPRMVRDLSRAMGKRVHLELVGGETELDRSVLEAVKDPITHLVRNALDHGIEPAEARLAAGKPLEGRLTLRAYHDAGQMRLEISDDGAGIDLERIAATAVATGLLTERQVRAMAPRDLVDCIFLPGFTTARRVTNVSGRGVGMDVVKTNLERIGGSIDVVSQPGHGTTFHVKIPLTLAIVAALIVSAGGNRYAVPQANVLELVRVEGGESAGRIERIAGAPVYRLRGELLPLVVLREALGAEPAPLDGTGADNAVTIAVVGSPDRRFGLVVDDVLDTEDIVVKPLSRQLKGIGCYAGATILGDGRVSLILDVWSIASATNVGAVATRARRGETETTSNRAASLLVTRLRGGRLLAVPLAGVTRLEEVPATQVEPVGHRQALQYHGGILPIVRLDDLVDAGAVPGQRSSANGDEPLRVVVYTERGRSVGLVVDEIVDVTDDVAGFVTDIDGPGVTGTTVVQEQVMELLDIRAAILAADPHFYDAARDRDQTTARA